MKVALCFIISYEHILNKEEIWKEWIECNKDIINVYFFYKEISKIKSEWILKHVLPSHYIYETSYYNVVPAYVSLMRYAMNHDSDNLWFAFLTDSCCPIMSPKRFRYLFFSKYNQSILSWKKAWWNIEYHKRANLKLIPENLRLANDPYFILTREDAINCLRFIKYNPQLSNTIIKGGLANESFFAISLQYYNKLDNVICKATHMVDWSRMMTSTSPYLFEEMSETNTRFIEHNKKKHKYNIFIRKISPDFPDDVLKYYIYKYSKNEDDELVIVTPIIYYKKIIIMMFSIAAIGLGFGIYFSIMQ
jgi:hypothetical protein